MKNTQVTSAINTCLEGFSSTSCISLPEALEIAPSGTSAANPLVQGCALRWLKTIAHAAPAAVMGKQIGGLTSLVLPLTDAGTGDVRNAAFDALVAAGCNESQHLP